jgi:hypothetical protein
MQVQVAIYKFGQLFPYDQHTFFLAIHGEEQHAYTQPLCLLIPLPIDEVDDFKG